MLPAIVGRIWQELRPLIQDNVLSVKGSTDLNKINELTKGRYSRDELSAFVSWRKNELKRSGMSRHSGNAPDVETTLDMSGGQAELYDSAIELIKKLKRSEKKMLARKLEDV